MGAISLILTSVFTFANVVKTVAGISWALVKMLGTVVGLLAWALFVLISLVVRRGGRRLADGTSVWVRRDWNDHRVGAISWSDLRDPRWDRISGGEQNHTPQPFIHAYVWCDRVKGDIAHSCIHGPPPHNIKVCLVRKDNNKQVWSKLLELAGPKPRRRWLIGGYR